MPELQAAILKFLLATGCTATLTDDQLEHAEAAACRACAQSEDLDVIAILSAARHTIAAVLKFRRTCEQVVLPGTAIVTVGERPRGGWEAPIVPPRPRIPPSDGAALIQPAGSAVLDVAF